MQKLQNLQSHRIFSEPLKRKIVKDIESGRAKVSAVLREYEVSHTAVYKWLKQYSSELKPSTKVVLQMESEGYKAKEVECIIIYHISHQSHPHQFCAERTLSR